MRITSRSLALAAVVAGLLLPGGAPVLAATVAAPFQVAQDTTTPANQMEKQERQHQKKKTHKRKMSTKKGAPAASAPAAAPAAPAAGTTK